MNKIAMYEEILETHPLWTKEAGYDAKDVSYAVQRGINRVKKAVGRERNTGIKILKNKNKVPEALAEMYRDKKTGHLRTAFSAKRPTKYGVINEEVSYGIRKANDNKRAKARLKQHLSEVQRRE